MRDIRGTAKSPLRLLRFYRYLRISARDLGRIDELNACDFELLFDLRDGAVEVEGAAGIADEDGFKAEAASVKRGVAHAVVVGQAGEKNAGEIPLVEITGQAGGSFAVILKKGGVGIDSPAESFAEDQLGLWQMETGVELGAVGALGTGLAKELELRHGEAILGDEGYVEGEVIF